MVCAWNVCLVFCVVVWCAVSSCVRGGAGVQCAFVARVCLCGVWRGLARGKKPCASKTPPCTVITAARVEHAGVLTVHTETF